MGHPLRMAVNRLSRRTVPPVRTKSWKSGIGFKAAEKAYKDAAENSAQTDPDQVDKFVRGLQSARADWTKAKEGPLNTAIANAEADLAKLRSEGASPDSKRYKEAKRTLALLEEIPGTVARRMQRSVPGRLSIKLGGMERGENGITVLTAKTLVTLAAV